MKTIKDLTPNPRNPRTISDSKLNMLKKSMKEFGSLDGMIFNKRSNRLVGGHQRRTVDPDAPITITKVYDTPTEVGTVEEGFILINGESYPYRGVDWDDKKEMAANIAANKGAGQWDFPELSNWFIELDDGAFDLNLTMFDAEEREKIIVPVEKVAPGCDEDEIPELQEEPKTRLGDIYQLGNHRLMCGDSTSIDAVEKLMNGEKADMMFTDPPYGMNLDTKYSKMAWKGKCDSEKGRDYSKVIGDDVEFDPGIILGFFEYVKEVFLWGADHYYWNLPKNGSWIIWDKRRSDNFEVKETVDNIFGSHFEACWSKERHRREIYRIYRVFGASEGKGEERHKGGTAIHYHPTQKPTALFERVTENIEAKIVVDLFGGSGSTLIACEKTNRHCFMMELDPYYCDIILSRWEKYSGKKSLLVTEPDNNTIDNARVSL